MAANNLEEQAEEYSQEEQVIQEQPVQELPHPRKGSYRSISEYNDIVRLACGSKRRSPSEYDEIVRQACGVRRRKQI